MEYIYIKAVLDKILALIALILVLPILIIASVLIYIKMKRPIFFIQPRVGKNEKIFKIIKFRTMSEQKDKNGELLSDEQRLGKLGSLLRAYSIDELPQLINILKGDMSFIGPRPLLVEYLPLYSSKQKKRHNVLSGITGLAQVNGRNAISWSDRFDYDVHYVENISFALDVKIFFKTIYKIFHKEGISSSTSSTMEKFRGND